VGPVAPEDPVAGDQAVPADWMVRVGGAQTALVAVVPVARVVPVVLVARAVGRLGTENPMVP